jgi:hypothetical protein
MNRPPDDPRITSPDKNQNAKRGDRLGGRFRFLGRGHTPKAKNALPGTQVRKADDDVADGSPVP